MTIALVINIPEGIILASDSQSTLNAAVPVSQSGKAQITFRHPVNKFEKAQKIFQLSNDEIIMGVLQFGNAFPGGRPFSNHIYSIRDLLHTSNASSVEEGKNLIQEHFSKFDPKSVHGLGFYLVGYKVDETDFIFTGYHIFWPQNQDCKIKEISDELEKYGANWSGTGGWIVTKLMNLQDEEQKIAPAAIPWPFLSLSDGVDLGEFLIRTVTGFERFQSRFPTCGGEPQISVITPTNYTIVKAASKFAV